MGLIWLGYRIKIVVQLVIEIRRRRFLLELSKEWGELPYDKVKAFK